MSREMQQQQAFKAASKSERSILLSRMSHNRKTCLRCIRSLATFSINRNESVVSVRNEKFFKTRRIGGRGLNHAPLAPYHSPQVGGLEGREGGIIEIGEELFDDVGRVFRALLRHFLNGGVYRSDMIREGVDVVVVRLLHRHHLK